MKQIDNTKQEKILIIGPSWVGDMVMAQSLFIALKQRNPNVLIDVLAPAWSKPILERMPEVNNVIDMPIGHGRFGFLERRSIGKRLRNKFYTQSITLPNSWKSALIPFFAKIPLRTGWKGEARYFLLNDLRHLNKEKYPLMVQRYAALAFPKNTIISPKEIAPPALTPIRKNQTQIMSKLGLDHNNQILVICPGAEFGPSKQWPAQHYAQVSIEKLNEGWQVWVMGSNADKAIADEIIINIHNDDHQNKIHNLCGKTSLEDAIDLIDLADHVISNDSGLMHVASALHKPLTAIYGSTSPEFTPPLSDSATTIAIDVDCGPCFKRQCPIKNHKCMVQLQPSQVLNSFQNTKITNVKN